MTRRPILFSTLANTGRYALVPPVVAGLILPGVLLLIRTGGAPQLAPAYIEKCVTLLLPAMAAWWAPFVFKERIEGDGRELLYFLRRNGEGTAALGLGALYLLLLAPFVLVATGTPDFSANVVMLLAARCLFMNSLAFGAAYLLKSGALGLMLALLFNMVAMMPLESFAGSMVEPSLAASTTTVLYIALSVSLLLIGEAKGRSFSR